MRSLPYSLTLLLAGALASPVGARDAEPVFTAASQYTALLEQKRGRWRLLSPDGADLIVEVAARDCRESRLPLGIWMLTRDASGRPSLLAPSVTRLPAGHPELVALLPCGERADAASVSAPASLIEWLSQRVGSIRVEA
jgi:hypothetical protein